MIYKLTYRPISKSSINDNCQPVINKILADVEHQSERFTFSITSNLQPVFECLGSSNAFISVKLNVINI